MVPDFNTIMFPTPIWIDKIGDYEVKHHEIPRLGGPSTYYRISVSTGAGGLHTTESSGIEGAINAMEHNLSIGCQPDPCHIIVGQDQIIQTRPIGVQAASMRDPANSHLTVQIECVGFSKQLPWVLIDSTRKPLIATLAYCAQNFGIPLTKPAVNGSEFNFPDDCSDLKGQVWVSPTNSRRKQLLPAWDRVTGWIAHLEAIGNVHWDQGAIDRTPMLKEAHDLLTQWSAPEFGIVSAEGGVAA